MSDGISAAQKAPPEPQTISQAVNQGLDDGFTSVAKVGIHIAAPLVGWLSHRWSKQNTVAMEQQKPETPGNTTLLKPFKSEPGQKF